MPAEERKYPLPSKTIYYKLHPQPATGDNICTHALASGKGLKIINTDHKRDKTTAIGELISIISLLTKIPDQATEWLKTIQAAKPRYVRDQLLLIRKTVESNQGELITKTILYCLANKIASAVDFDAIIQQHHRTTTNDDQKVIPLNPLSGNHLNHAILQPQKSSIADYQDIVSKSSK